MAHDHQQGFANQNPAPGGPAPLPRAGFANPAPTGPRPVREPANPPAAWSASANANPGPQQGGPASERTNPHMPPVSEPANPGATGSPEPAPRFANPPAARLVPPESPAEITAPLALVREPSAFANPNPSAGSLPPGLEVRKPSLWALLGLTEDARLREAGYIGERAHGLTWRYEPREQAVRRHERRLYNHDLRMRSREFARRLDSLKLALAPRLGLEWFQVDLRAPVEYEDTGARTGDVIVRRGDVRLREASDPEDMPELAPVRLVLPDGFHPESKSLLLGLIKEYLAGEWSAKWYLTSHPHFAEFSRDRQKPAPPATVKWQRTDDLYTVHIGHDGVDDVFISIKTDVPHWGVSAGSGKGKTTTLLSPLQHARSHGALVDIIDLKEDSFDKAAATKKKNRFNVDVFENVSGVRVHRDVKSAVTALAEFYVSIKSIRLAREAGYDMSTVPPRFLILDEFGSFVQSADSWWKFGLGQKGETPFRSWFHQILMQGRSKDHRVIVGTHDYQRATFGNSSVRDLIGTKILIRDTSQTAFMMAFGQNVKRIKINENHPGRAIIGVTGQSVRELQLAYTPEDECLDFLLSLPPAPEWFDRGEIAPWITAESIARSHEEMFVAPFMPGGKFVTPREVGAGDNPGTLPPGQGQQPTPGLRVALTESEQRERENAEILTQREVLERGYLMQLIREAEHRQPGRTPDQLMNAALKTMRKARDEGKFPAARGKGTNGFLYQVGEIRAWEESRSNRIDFDALPGDDSDYSESDKAAGQE